MQTLVINLGAHPCCPLPPLELSICRYKLAQIPTRQTRQPRRLQLRAPCRTHPASLKIIRQQVFPKPIGGLSAASLQLLCPSFALFQSRSCRRAGCVAVPGHGRGSARGHAVREKAAAAHYRRASKVGICQAIRSISAYNRPRRWVPKHRLRPAGECRKSSVVVAG